jgi:hypothetical protein
LAKLRPSGAAERHLFLVVPSFAETPFGVTQLLTSDDAELPIQAPALPPEVTHVWTACTWAPGTGMRWDPAMGWSKFEKQFDAAP